MGLVVTCLVGVTVIMGGTVCHVDRGWGAWGLKLQCASWGKSVHSSIISMHASVGSPY